MRPPPFGGIRCFGGVNEMYEAERGRGRAGDWLLPGLLANAEGDSNSDGSSSSDDEALLDALVRARLVRVRLERKGGRDWRAHGGFPANHRSFALSFSRSWRRCIPTPWFHEVMGLAYTSCDSSHHGGGVIYQRPRALLQRSRRLACARFDPQGGLGSAAFGAPWGQFASDPSSASGITSSLASSRATPSRS